MLLFNRKLPSNKTNLNRRQMSITPVLFVRSLEMQIFSSQHAWFDVEEVVRALISKVILAAVVCSSPNPDYSG